MLGSCDLSVRGTGGESCRDGGEQRGALEVVGRRERLPRAAVLAVAASEARDASAVAWFPIPAVALEASSGGSMSDAFGPGAEGRKEAGGTHRFCGQSWPVHEPTTEQGTGRTKATEIQDFSVRRPSETSAGGHPRWSAHQQARGHRALIRHFHDRPGTSVARGR